MIKNNLILVFAIKVQTCQMKFYQNDDRPNSFSFHMIFFINFFEIKIQGHHENHKLKKKNIIHQFVSVKKFIFSR